MISMKKVCSTCLPVLSGFIFSVFSVNASAYEHACSVFGLAGLTPNLIYNIDISAADYASYNYTWQDVRGSMDEPYTAVVIDQWGWGLLSLRPSLYTWHFASDWNLHAFMEGSGQIAEINYAASGLSDWGSDNCPTGGTWLYAD